MSRKHEHIIHLPEENFSKEYGDLDDINELNNTILNHVATVKLYMHILIASILSPTLCDKVCQGGGWFSHYHDIAEILLKVALNTITITLEQINAQML
jgi:hypothetical protein